MAQENKGSFVRWQQITRDQFTSVANLVFVLATGLLAFQSNMLLNHKFTYCCAYGFAIASLFLLAASVVFALFCAVNRLRDFRLTANIARCSEKEKTDLEELRGEANSLGSLSWALFWIQLTFFGLGAGCTALSVIIQIWPHAL
ncbi:MAG: hypothetical protein HOP25_00375 [Methylotenera sp.]|nr:hypothetical protein [Methylotenera sp.]